MSHLGARQHQTIVHLWPILVWVILVGVGLLDARSDFSHIHVLSLVTSAQDWRGLDGKLEHRDLAKFNKRQPRKGGTDGKPPTKQINESLWQKLKDLFTRKGKEAGTRSQGLCLITPNKTQSVYRSWSDRPLFVWQGSVTSIKLYLPGSHPQSKPLWDYRVQGDENSIIYNGEQPLQRGQEYVYHFEYTLKINEKNYTEKDKSFFKIIGQQEYVRISNELSHYNLNIIPVDVDLAEQIIVKRALYFAERNLFFDAVQEIFMRTANSSGWAKKMHEVQQAFCPNYEIKKMLVSHE